LFLTNVFFCRQFINFKSNKMSKIEPNIHESWKNQLTAEFQSDYFFKLRDFLKKEQTYYEIFPPGNKIFAAFDAVPFEEVKVVILGQDPYHGPGQANGLSFSVSREVAMPPSLKNIFKELNSDLGIPFPEHGDLNKWARQGVFLLNATLTVRKRQPRSHQNQGWERFTGNVIKTLSENRERLIFLLWGRYAGMKEELIDNKKHFVLKAAHPSPYSAHKGFFGCRHFSKTNNLLNQMGRKPIDWDLSEKNYEL